MKRILVPTDFTDLSQYAVKFATQLAAPVNAEIHAVHFTDVPLGDTSLHLTGEAHSSGYSEDELYNVQLFRANKNKLAKIQEDYRKSGVVVKGELSGGGFLKGIQDYVEKNAVDLVVMGTTGEESIQEFFTGNHTEQLIEHLKVPVLSLQKEVYSPIKDIVLGIDLLDEKYTQMAFPMVKVVSEALNARLHIVNVVKEEPEVLMSALNKMARAVGLKDYLVEVVQAKDELEAILDYADQCRAGLVITLSEARSGLYRFFQHSFASRVTKASEVPVMTINKRILEGR